MNRTFRRIVITLSFAVTAFVIVFGYKYVRSIHKGIVIGITQHQQASWADLVRNGFIEEMKQRGYKEGVFFKYKYICADGDIQTMTKIANQFVADEVNLIFSISTQSSQAIANETRTIPIIFGAVTDPVAAGLVKSLEVPGGNVTGTSDVWPVRKQLELMKAIIPDLRWVGIVYNPGEANSVSNMIQVRKHARELQIGLAEIPASNTNEVFMAANNLPRQCQCFYIPADNTVLQAVESVVNVGNLRKIPVFAGDPSPMDKGAIATYSINYFDIGKLSADMAIQVLYEKENPATLSVKIPTDYDLILNLKAAKNLGISFPESLMNQARRIVQ